MNTTIKEHSLLVLTPMADGVYTKGVELRYNKAKEGVDLENPLAHPPLYLTVRSGKSMLTVDVEPAEAKEIAEFLYKYYREKVLSL